MRCVVPSSAEFLVFADLLQPSRTAKREELFGPLGIKVRPFRDPQGSNRIGLIVETPNLETWHAALQTDHAQEAMKHDGVRPDTILELVEG